MERILSGIKPTGELTLGNYIGSIRQFIEMQKKYLHTYPVWYIMCIQTDDNHASSVWSRIYSFIDVNEEWTFTLMSMSEYMER